LAVLLQIPNLYLLIRVLVNGVLAKKILPEFYPFSWSYLWGSLILSLLFIFLEYLLGLFIDRLDTYEGSVNKTLNWSKEKFNEINNKLDLLDKRFKSSEVLYFIGRTLREKADRGEAHEKLDDIVFKVGKAVKDIFEQNGVLIPDDIKKIEECILNSKKYFALTMADIYR